MVSPPHNLAFCVAMDVNKMLSAFAGYSDPIRTLRMVGVSLKDLWKSSNINGLQVASKAFILIK